MKYSDIKLNATAQNVFSTGYFTVYTNPFHNCQLFSIGSAYTIFANNRDNDDVIKILYKAHVSAGSRKLLMIDIQECYIPYVDKFFEKEGKQAIMLKHPYVNSNNSKMNIYLLDLRILRTRFDKLIEIENEEERKILEEKRKLEKDKQELEQKVLEQLNILSTS